MAVAFSPAQVATQIGIVAFSNDTQVSVVPSLGTNVFFMGISLTPGVPNNFTMNAFDTVQLQSTGGKLYCSYRMRMKVCY